MVDGLEVFPVGPLLIGDGLERVFGALSCEENDEFGGGGEVGGDFF